MTGVSVVYWAGTAIAIYLFSRLIFKIFTKHGQDDNSVSKKIDTTNGLLRDLIKRLDNNGKPKQADESDYGNL
ncbi:MAG: hypothetical protein Q8N90_03580 [bacterium]|nr:hypothetical protein [bacterium]